LFSTENAQKHIASVLTADKSKYFRITVLGGGCAGFQYKFDFDNQKNEDDIVIKTKEIAVIVDTTSLDLIKGSKIDYVNELIGSSFKIIDTSTTDVEVWTFTLNDGLTAKDSVTPDTIVDFTSATISTPVSDCFMFVRQDKGIGITRVGDPDVLVIVYTGIINQTIPYDQYGMDGGSLDSGNMTEIGEGFYYVTPAKLDESFFVINGVIKTLVVPYKVVNNGNGVFESFYFSFVSV